MSPLVAKRPFGRHGLEVGEIAVGTWAMGGGIYGAVDDDESLRTIRRANDLGVDLIDTAPIYGMGTGADGHAERLVCRAIAGERSRWIVSTKWGRTLVGGPGDATRSDQDFSYGRALRSVEESLTRLGTDYVDVYFVHSPIPYALFDPRSLDAMDELKEAGTIHFRGFSLGSARHDVDAIEPFIRDGRLDCIQVELSLLRQAAKEKLLDLCADFGLAVLAREALARGMLADTFASDTAFPPTDFRSRLPRDELERQLAAAGDYRFLTSDGRSLPQAAISWVLSQREVSSVVVGAKSMTELEELVAATMLSRFDEQSMERTGAVYARHRAECVVP